MAMPYPEPAGTTDDHRRAKGRAEATGARVVNALAEEAESLQAGRHTGSRFSREPVPALQGQDVRAPVPPLEPLDEFVIRIIEPDTRVMPAHFQIRL